MTEELGKEKKEGSQKDIIQSPRSDFLGTINSGMKVLEALGIQKRDVGKFVIKQFVGGKLGFFGEETTARKSKFENLANGIKTLVWTIVGGVVVLMVCQALLTYFVGSVI